MPRKGYLITILTMMSSCGLLANDIFLPALPNMADSFGLTAVGIQSILILFLLAMGVMQLVYGPVSDRFGRRPVLLGGIGIFFIASLILTFAKRYEDVLILRVAQGIGACAGIALARAVVNDLYDRREAGGVIVILSTVMGIMPGVAPIIGGLLFDGFGWQACAMFTALYALSLLIVLSLALPETAPSEKRISPTFYRISKDYAAVFSNRLFWRYASVPCFAYAAYFSYISESPFLLENKGLGTFGVSLSYISLSVTYVLASIWARRLMRNNDLDNGLRIGYVFFWIGGISTLVAQILYPQMASLTVAAMAILTFGNGFLLPLGTTGTLTSVNIPGAAAPGLLGFFQFTIAAAAAQITSLVSRHDPVVFGVIISVLVTLGMLMNLAYSSQKDRKVVAASN